MFKPYYELDIQDYELIRENLEKALLENLPEGKTTVFCIGKSGCDAVKPYEQILSKLISNLKLPNVVYMANLVKAGERMEIHIDDSPQPWSLLLPIKNTRNTKLNFYRSECKPHREYAKDNLGVDISWLTVPADSVEITHTIEVVRPMFIYQQTLHQAINDTNLDRMTLALVCITEYNPLVAKEYFLTTASDL